MEKSIDSYFTEILGVTYTNPREYSPLSLAYIGDSVFDLLIKTLAVTKDNKQAYKYHKEVSQLVKAEAQAEEEWIYKRGRNTKTHSTAKNATVGQYRMATGFECLIGFLYLDKQYDRMFEITRIILNHDPVETDMAEQQHKDPGKAAQEDTIEDTSTLEKSTESTDGEKDAE